MATNHISPKRVPLQCRPCIVCGCEFSSSQPRAVVCGSKCSEIRAERLRSPHRLKPMQCRECNTIFVPKYGNKRRTFCCQACGDKHSRRISKAKRKAKQRGLSSEAVNPLLVFERDGWRCQLCWCSTPRRLRGKMVDRAPELDHIIPLAIGGEHSYRNTQCACRACNIAKGARPLGQMRLIA
jgi:5-methylcytosine-specific restriction endonuclease McrA